MRDQLRDRCGKIEECYEFMLAYAAQGLRTEPGGGGGSQLRTLLTQCDEALDGLGDVFTRDRREANSSGPRRSTMRSSPC